MPDRFTKNFFDVREVIRRAYSTYEMHFDGLVRNFKILFLNFTDQSIKMHFVRTVRSYDGFAQWFIIDKYKDILSPF